jgi:hypothetical protein
MRFIAAVLIALLISLAPAAAAPPQKNERPSSEALLMWINGYRAYPNLAAVPSAVRTMSRIGVFRDPDSAGVYVGFLAGVLNSHPVEAEDLIAKILPLPPEDQWVIVRAIAYSGLADWKGLMRSFRMHMPGRQAMMEKYLDGRLATLDQVAFRKNPGLLDKLKGGNADTAVNPAVLEPTPDTIDTLWGFYFATGAYQPVARIIAMVPWSKDRNNVDKLTLGGMAKFTLATNAARDHELLAMLKWAAKHQSKKSAAMLDEVIEAAETVDTAKIRKVALVAIEDLRRKGPGHKRDASLWGQLGQGALAVGCIAAAATGHVELGLPCVIGGAASSAALNVWGAQQ